MNYSNNVRRVMEVGIEVQAQAQEQRQRLLEMKKFMSTSESNIRDRMLMLENGDPGAPFPRLLLDGQMENVRER